MNPLTLSVAIPASLAALSLSAIAAPEQNRKKREPAPAPASTSSRLQTPEQPVSEAKEVGTTWRIWKDTQGRQLEAAFYALKDDWCAVQQFQRVPLNSQTYERAASPTPDLANAPYVFPGPVTRRLSAKKTWNSLLTLATGPQIDKTFLRRGAKMPLLALPDGNPTLARCLVEPENGSPSGETARSKTQSPCLLSFTTRSPRPPCLRARRFRL